MLKVTVDANIWVSALLNSGPAREVAQDLQSKQAQLVCSQELFDELVDVLSRQKLQARIIKAEAEELLTWIKNAAVFVKIDQSLQSVAIPKTTPILPARKLLTVISWSQETKTFSF